MRGRREKRKKVFRSQEGSGYNMELSLLSWFGPDSVDEREVDVFINNLVLGVRPRQDEKESKRSPIFVSWDGKERVCRKKR